MTSDHYTAKAKAAGFRARSAYKLMQMDAKYHFLKAGDSVLDLGCWPGGWMIVAQRKGCQKIVGIDLEPIERIPGTEFIHGNIEDENVLGQLKGKFDVVLSDLAPHTTGNHIFDVNCSVALAEEALEIAKRFLKPGGHFLVKIFQGKGYIEYVNEMKHFFSYLKTIKPDASKQKSREMYVLGLGFR